ncbi:hypothetical protein EDC01DRAFT_315251 [Geopyxis carbonaria]|nr:hypothetical protein EDC01DRAFT_315251 [Geopyxis carbonaria]
MNYHLSPVLLLFLFLPPYFAAVLTQTHLNKPPWLSSLLLLLLVLSSDGSTSTSISLSSHPSRQPKQILCLVPSVSSSSSASAICNHPPDLLTSTNISLVVWCGGRAGLRKRCSSRHCSRHCL